MTYEEISQLREENRQLIKKTNELRERFWILRKKAIEENDIESRKEAELMARSSFIRFPIWYCKDPAPWDRDPPEVPALGDFEEAGKFSDALYQEKVRISLEKWDRIWMGAKYTGEVISTPSQNSSPRTSESEKA